MAKKKKVRVKRGKGARDKKAGGVTVNIHDIIKDSIQDVMGPLSTKFLELGDLIENVKSNTVVCLSILEKKEIISREEFFEEFERYQKEEALVINGDGRMSGDPIFSIYTQRTKGQVV